MNIGSLYRVKKWFWMLFPTKETIIAMAAAAADDNLVAFAYDAAVFDAAAARHPAAAVWYSKRYNCEVTYFSPDSYIVFLEEDGAFKKVLTSDGKIGWIWFIEIYNDCFEEVKTE